MRSPLVLRLLALCGVSGFASLGLAQSQPNSVALRPATPAETQQNAKFTFLLFSRGNDANTQRVTNELSTALSTRADRAEWQAIDITDPASQHLVKQYQLSRAPMPLVLCVAPNGTITGVMPGRVTEKAVEASLVTPTMTRCMKSLQAGKIVVVHVKTDANEELPACAIEFMADPSFEKRTATESFLLADPAEGRFLRDMKLDPATASGSTVVVLAPPGMLVGKFAATATASEIASALHEAGKCCNDPNCKHNKKGQ